MPSRGAPATKRSFVALLVFLTALTSHASTREDYIRKLGELKAMQVTLDLACTAQEKGRRAGTPTLPSIDQHIIESFDAMPRALQKYVHHLLDKMYSTSKYEYEQCLDQTLNGTSSLFGPLGKDLVDTYFTSEHVEFGYVYEDATNLKDHARFGTRFQQILTDAYQNHQIFGLGEMHYQPYVANFFALILKDFTKSDYNTLIVREGAMVANSPKNQELWKQFHTQMKTLKDPKERVWFHILAFFGLLDHIPGRATEGNPEPCVSLLEQLKTTQSPKKLYMELCHTYDSFLTRIYILKEGIRNSYGIYPCMDDVQTVVCFDDCRFGDGLDMTNPKTFMKAFLPLERAKDLMEYANFDLKFDNHKLILYGGTAHTSLAGNMDVKCIASQCQKLDKTFAISVYLFGAEIDDLPEIYDVKLSGLSDRDQKMVQEGMAHFFQSSGYVFYPKLLESKIDLHSPKETRSIAIHHGLLGFLLTSLRDKNSLLHKNPELKISFERLSQKLPKGTDGYPIFFYNPKAAPKNDQVIALFPMRGLAIQPGVTENQLWEELDEEGQE